MRAQVTSRERVRSTALARLFSATVLKELAGRGRSPVLVRLILESGLNIDPNSTEHIKTIFDLAFAQLRRPAHRHEYVYKAAFTQRVLLGVHSLQTASMMTEFRVGRSKVDVVILNRTGTAYEIKSERDNLDRLVCQVEACSRVFAAVNVVAGENHLEHVVEIVPDHVGILALSDRFQVKTIRAAKDDPSRTDAASIFDAINQKEAELILRENEMSLPDVPNTQRYATLQELFVQLDSRTAHRSMVKCLKRTRNLQNLSGVLNAVPESLRAAVVSAKLNRHQQDKMVNALRTPICEAVVWR